MSRGKEAMNEKLNLVKFADGKWGIQRISVTDFRDIFLDLKNRGYWWDSDHSHFKYCKGEEYVVRNILRHVRYEIKERWDREEARKLAATYEVVDE